MFIVYNIYRVESAHVNVYKYMYVTKARAKRLRTRKLPRRGLTLFREQSSFG